MTTLSRLITRPLRPRPTSIRSRRKPPATGLRISSRFRSRVGMEHCCHRFSGSCTTTTCGSPDTSSEWSSSRMPPSRY
jgi:hypothetical protein